MGAPKGYSQFELPTMGGGQKQIYDLLKSQSLGGGGDVLSRLFGTAGGDQQGFDQMEAPAMRQFQQQILPGIANRYAGSGISGSSGMQNAFAGAGTDLAERLQSNRMGYHERARDQVMNLMQSLLGTPTSQFGLVQKPNMMADIMKLLGTGVGTGLGNLPLMKFGK